jgi:hypothetical protein
MMIGLAARCVSLRNGARHSYALLRDRLAEHRAMALGAAVSLRAIAIAAMQDAWARQLGLSIRLQRAAQIRKNQTAGELLREGRRFIRGYWY